MIRVNKAFIILFVMSFILVLLIGGTLPYYIFYGLLTIFILGIIYAAIQREYVDAEVKLQENVYSAGDTMECLTIIKCSTVLAAPYVVVKSQSFVESFSGYHGQMINLTMEENSWLRSNIKFYKRGVYDLGTVHLKISDLFQIFEVNKTIDCNSSVKVYPKIYKLKKISIGGRDIYQDAVDIHSTNEDLFTIRDVRKYNQGDSIKKIHWKVSARHDELYVKNSNNISGEEFTVFLDMNKSNLNLDEHGEREEAMIDLCASLVYYMLQKGIGIKVLINCSNGRIVNVTSKEQFDGLMNLLLTQKSDGEIEFGEFLHKNFYKLQRNNRIAVIAGKIDSRLCNNIAKIRSYGYSISLFYSAAADVDESSMSYLRNLGVEHMSISSVLQYLEAK